MTLPTDIPRAERQLARIHSGRLLGIFMLAWLSLFAGINTIPIEQHEAYVLQAAREMAVNMEWVVPYFNDEPRLNKPPLNYWLTLGIAALDPFSTDVEPWHGRAWSLSAALLLVLMTAYMGNKLYGPPTGFLASAFLLASKGFTVFSHDARPDFLYAALSVLQLYAWIAAWRARDKSQAQRLNAGLGWLFAGLATLAKGPQVPAVFLCGFLLFLLCGVDRSRVLTVLRPFSGMLIWLTLCLPWWLLLQERVGVLGVDLGNSQLSGSLLVISSLKEILNFFYLSRLLDFLLPVSLLVPLLYLLNRKRYGKFDESSRLLLYVVLFFLLVFTLAGHQRSRYMLPLLPLVSLMLAAVVTRTESDCIPGKAWQLFFWLESAALLVFPILLFIRKEYATSLLLLSAGFLLTLLLRKELVEPVWRDHPFIAKLTGCFLLVPLFFAGFNAYVIRPSRVWDREFSLSVNKVLHPADLLVSLGNYPPVLAYYTRHSVVHADDCDDLRSFYEQKGAGQNFYLLVHEGELVAVKKIFEAMPVTAEVKSEHPENRLFLVKIVNIRS